MLRQLVGFGGVGVLAALVHYGVLIALVSGANCPPTPAALAAYACGGVLSYVLSRRWAFVSAAPHPRAAARFAIVAAVGFLLTGAIMHVLADIARLPYLLAQLAATAAVLGWSFGAHRYWTFR